MTHVVIIGAGVVGAHVALAAKLAGFDVTVVEPGLPGGEHAASYGNAGWLSSHSVLPPAEPGAWRRVPSYVRDPLGPLAINPTYLFRAMPWLMRYLLSGWTEARILRTAHALRQLLVDAVALHRSVAARAGLSELIADEMGLLHIYRDRNAFLREERAWRVRRETGVRWVELDGTALAAREPYLVSSYRFGVEVGEAGYCTDPGAYVAGLATYAERCGVQFVQARATGFCLSQGRLQAVTTNLGNLEADRAVICSGAHSRSLAQAVGDRIPLESERGYHVRIADVDKVGRIGPMTPMMAHDRKVVVTHTRNALRVTGQVEIAGIAAAPNWSRAEILRRHVLEMFPGLPRDLAPERLRMWMGHRPSTPDGLPVIGSASSSTDVFYAFGHGHIGLVSSARTARLVVGLLVEADPEIDLAPFSPRRF